MLENIHVRDTCMSVASETVKCVMPYTTPCENFKKFPNDLKIQQNAPKLASGDTANKIHALQLISYTKIVKILFINHKNIGASTPVLLPGSHLDHLNQC